MGQLSSFDFLTLFATFCHQGFLPAGFNRLKPSGKNHFCHHLPTLVPRKVRTVYPEAAEIVHQNTYVDDALVSASSAAEAVRLASDLKHLCQTGAFNMSKFVSNSAALLQSVPREDRGKNVKDLDLELESLKTRACSGHAVVGHGRHISVSLCRQTEASDEERNPVNCQRLVRSVGHSFSCNHAGQGPGAETVFNVVWLGRRHPTTLW